MPNETFLDSLSPSAAALSAAELRAWLESILARELSMSVEEVRRVKRFDEMGVDSILAVFIASELEERLHRPISTNVLYEYPDVDSLLRSLSPYA